MRLQFIPQHVFEIAVHKLIVVTNVEADELLASQGGAKLISQPFLVAFLHHEYNICPPNVAFGDSYPGILLRARGAYGITGVPLLHLFCSQAAPAVLAANEQDFERVGHSEHPVCPYQKIFPNQIALMFV